MRDSANIMLGLESTGVWHMKAVDEHYQVTFVQFRYT